MNSAVKIIKRDRVCSVPGSPHPPDQKVGRQLEREIAGTVKNWISELAQRKRAEVRSAVRICDAHL